MGILFFWDYVYKNHLAMTEHHYEHIIWIGIKQENAFKVKRKIYAKFLYATLEYSNNSKIFFGSIAQTHTHLYKNVYIFKRFFIINWMVFFIK